MREFVRMVKAVFLRKRHALIYVSIIAQLWDWRCGLIAHIAALEVAAEDSLRLELDLAPPTCEDPRPLPLVDVTPKRGKFHQTPHGTGTFWALVSQMRGCRQPICGGSLVPLVVELRLLFGAGMTGVPHRRG